MTEPKCLCGIDHAKQREMADAFRRLSECFDIAQLIEAGEIFSRLSEILTPDTLPPYDPNCVKCQEGLFVGSTPCDLHLPPPPVKPSKKKKAKK